MNPDSEACAKIFLILLFAGAFSTFPASAQSQQIDAQTERHAVASDATPPETSEVSDTGSHSPTARKLSRRAFREARRHAQLERIRVARAAQPAVAHVPGNAIAEAAIRTGRAPAAARDDVTLSFAIDAANEAASVNAVWTSASTFSRSFEGEVTLSAKVHGRDSHGQPIRLSPRWVAADNASVQVALAEDDVIKIKVRNAGESRLTVAGSGFSRDVRILASQQGPAMQVQISQ